MRFFQRNGKAFFSDLIGPKNSAKRQHVGETGPCKLHTENIRKHELDVSSSKRNSAGLQESALRLCFDFRRGPEHLPRVEQLSWAQTGVAGETPLNSGCLVDQRLLILLDFFSAAACTSIK